MRVGRLAGARGLLQRCKRLIIVAVVLVAIAFVPMFPYSPDCLQSYTPTSVGSVFLTRDYRQELTANLRLYGIPYVSVDGLVLLRFWSWFADPDSWVLNASNKVVRRLAEGEYYTGKHVPPHVREMVQQARTPDHLFIDLKCPLVHAVAIDGW